MLDRIWLEIVMDLRQFGLSLEMILNIKECFTKVWAKTIVPYPALEYYVAETICRENPAFLLIDNDGNSFFCLKNEYELVHIANSMGTHIQISLQNIIRRCFPSSKLKSRFTSIPIENSELELLELIRAGNFREIRIKLTDGEIHTIQATEYLDSNSRIHEILKKAPYQDIEIINRNGEIANIKRTINKKI